MSKSWSEWQEAEVSSTSEETCINQLPIEQVKMMSESLSEWQEAEVSSTSEETFFDQLPVEVIEIILKLIPRPLSVKYRVVCKTWCDILSRDRIQLFFNGTVPYDQLENCTFEKFDLTFRNVDINEVPQSVWEKIGFRVHSVELDSCILGDYQCLKNLIIHCQNLRSSRVFLRKNDDNEDCEFWLLHMLKKLNIIRRKLETFEFDSRQKITMSTDYCIQIFEDLLKVYPNVTHFIFGGYHIELEKPFTGEFRKTDLQKSTYYIVMNDDSTTPAGRIHLFPEDRRKFELGIYTLPQYLKRIIITVHPREQTITLHFKRRERKKIKKANKFQHVILP